MAIARLRQVPLTSTIIDPRIIEQLESQLPAADVKLSTEVLDRMASWWSPASR
jgi:aryl-alcohol dehydrogenase-like predicted oxidoreductase